ncbi:hypothetical protein OPV22_009583 [Ensete ventricosum]|uniref:XPG N-terminal domain-containing protein n=1 Tax=Ensete ventricosum TaxID=4639 RepID=A0AAV8RIT7_ENSVE|nr:hypothetical protein OPV22_009583 [Ensete ventricosum]
MKPLRYGGDWAATPRLGDLLRCRPLPLGGSPSSATPSSPTPSAVPFFVSNLRSSFASGSFTFLVLFSARSRAPSSTLVDKGNRRGRFEVARWMFEEMSKRKLSVLALDGIPLFDKMVGNGCDIDCVKIK